MIFIFVHGAWHRGACFQRIAASLRALKHTVLTPDLPHPLTTQQPYRKITLQCYLEALEALIVKQEEPVTLVGHSMGGIVISALGARLATRIQELIYLTAFIPKDQESLLSIAARLQSNQLPPHLIFDPNAQTIALKKSEALFRLFYNTSEETTARAAYAALITQPLRPWHDRVSLNRAFDVLPKRAFIATKDQVLLPEDQIYMAKSCVDRLIYVQADHAIYLSAASELVEKMTTHPVS